jgi:hypothetical protein
VLHRIADHQGEAARVVRGRRSGESPLAALRRHFLDGLDRRDPVTGLNDHERVLAYHRMVFSTPSLAARVASYTEAEEAALAEVLGGGLTARVAAGQVVATQRILARDNWRQLIEGRSADEVYPAAATAANEAFDLLERGLGHLG